MELLILNAFKFLSCACSSSEDLTFLFSNSRFLLVRFSTKQCVVIPPNSKGTHHTQHQANTSIRKNSTFLEELKLLLCAFKREPPTPTPLLLELNSTVTPL